SVGDATGKHNLASSGAAEKAEAQSKQQAADAESCAHGTANNIKGGAQKLAGSVAGDEWLRTKGHGNAAKGDAQRNL
ncbi:hypothetical protein BX616_006929, partial [Lobosporangium transversale]